MCVGSELRRQCLTQYCTNSWFLKLELGRDICWVSLNVFIKHATGLFTTYILTCLSAQVGFGSFHLGVSPPGSW